MIDFTSRESHVLLNPRMPDSERVTLERAGAAAALPAHVYIASSGSTGAPRLVALSKEALLASAAAVNRHLGATTGDAWLRVLPVFHVGGLSIHARAFLTGSRVVEAPWEAARFVAVCDEEKVSLSALVPAQVYDLVNGHYKAPPCIRAIVIGGGALTMDLYKSGRELGWPLLPSYGLTECCSQVATATVESPELRVLDHLEVRTDAENRLEIAGASLLTGYVGADGSLLDPRRGGWLTTSDLGHVQGRSVVVAGRVDDVVKIGGELVNVARLEAVLESLGPSDAALVAMMDERLGMVIHLAHVGGAGDLVERFNAQVAPYERIRRAHQLSAIPRSELGKVRRQDLRRLIEGSE